MKTYTIFLLSLFCPFIGFSQFSILLNGWADAELSHADSTSHFYYNEINRENIGWDVKPNSLNVLGEIKINPSISINLRGQLGRDKDTTFNQISLPLANVKYSPTEKDWAITVGRFITPFGSFAAKQHPKERTFINLPLAYSYYNNISPRIGFAEKMGEEKFKIDEEVQWGSTMLYYGAYSNGAMMEWSVIPDKLDWSIALTTHAPNIFDDKLDFSNMGFMTRFKYQPKYFWEQGFSLSYGSFLQDSERREQMENSPLSQTLIGTDFNLGFGFWEITGEVIGALYNVPHYNPTSENFGVGNIDLSSMAAYLNVKYEMPFLSGLYAACGVDYLTFSKFNDTNNYATERWDNPVQRFNFGVGYKITDFLLLRTNYMIQNIPEKKKWELNTWRTSLTIFL